MLRAFSLCVCSILAGVAAGQDVSQAFEDAAELGACVMACGVSREALRRLELRRRPRWRHIMQVGGAGPASALLWTAFEGQGP